MGYQEALQAAGAVVIDFRSFGDWQGRWYAKVNYKGAVSLIGGSFGSCSYCDSFQQEFDYQDRESPDYPERLAEFGRSYLDDPLDIGVEVKRLREASEWDMDSPEVLAWIERNFDTPMVIEGRDVEEVMAEVGKKLGGNETIHYKPGAVEGKPWAIHTYYGYDDEENRYFATLAELVKSL